MIGLICDKDGTLLDTEWDHLRAWERTGGLFGIRLETSDFLDLPCLPRPAVDALLLRLITERFAEAGRVLEETEARLLLDDMRIEKKKIVTAGQTQISGRPGLLQLLAAVTELREEGFEIRMAVATSDSAHAARTHLSRLGILEHFQSIIGADQVASPKPSPDVYLKALQELDLPASSCLAIEDTVPGMLAAREAGLRVAVIPDVTPPDRFRGEFQPTYLWSSLLDVVSHLKRITVSTSGTGSEGGR